MKIRKHTPLIRLFFSIGMLALTLLSTRAYSQAPFYQGKTVTVIASTSPAGTGDLRVKALLPFLRKHIPGNPTLVLEYMDGGGGRKAANYLFRNARPDGLTIGAMSSGIISLNIMRESGVLYDLDKFIYLGAPETAGHQTIYTPKELGLNNLEKLRAKSGLRIGAQTVGHVSYIAGRFFAYFIDFKDPKFIAGYTALEVDAALLRGELDARANAAVSVLRRNPDWLDKGVMGLSRHYGSAQGRQASSPGSPSRDRELCADRERKEASRCLARLQSSRLALLITAGNAQRARHHTPRGDAQGAERRRDAPRVSKAGRRRSGTDDARGADQNYQGNSSRHRDNRNDQGSFRRRPIAAKMINGSSSRSKSSSRSSRLTELWRCRTIRTSDD